MESLDAPISLTYVKSIASFLIEKVVVDINTSATIYVIIFDEYGLNIGNKSLTMGQTDYEQWGTDDGFIVAFVKAQLALIDTL
jgi:hypothetical protein